MDTVLKRVGLACGRRLYYWPGVAQLHGMSLIQISDRAVVADESKYAGIDGAIHLAEECKQPARVVPRALISTLTIGFVTSFVFAISMLYSLQDFDAVLSTSTGMPIYEIWMQATRSKGAATVFMMLLFIAAVMALTAVQQTASRLTWSLARDDALLFSKFIGRVHPTWQVPVWALIVNNFVVFIIGFIYLGSSTAFNAFIGTGLILQQATYAFPAALLLYRGRSSTFLPTNRPFKLRWGMGWVANFLTVAFAVIVMIFYNFPVVLPVTSSNMSEYPHVFRCFTLTFPDYTSAVIGVMIIFAVINWFLHAKSAYKGPRVH